MVIQRKKYKKSNGRPRTVDSISTHKFKMLILDGWHESKIAEFFGITPAALCIYKNKHEKFLKNLVDWKIEAIKNVEKALYKRAIGYEFDEVTREPRIVELEGESKNVIRELIVTKVVGKHIVPDVSAAMFILENKMADEYSNVKEHGGNTNYITAIVNSFNGSGNKSDKITEQNRVSEGLRLLEKNLSADESVSAS